MAAHPHRPSGSATAARPATLSEITAIVGGSDDVLYTAILRTEATPVEIRQAVAYHAGADDALGDLPPPLEGRSRLVYDLLVAHSAADLASDEEL